MDISSSHSDPLRDGVQDAVYRAVQVGSFAMTAVQVYAYHRRTQARVTAEQDQRARRALNAQVRAEREADRTRWAPALDPAWRGNASLVETAQAWGAALPYADRNVPWHEPAATTAMTRCEERLRHLHPYAMAHYDRLCSQGLGPAEAMREAAPLFAHHPRPRDASAVPRPVLETAPRPEAGPAPRTYPDGPAGYIRPGRSVRPCDEDFPLTIREVMAAQAELATVGSPRPDDVSGQARAAACPPPVTADGAAATVRLTMLAEVFFRTRLPGSWVPRYLAARGFNPTVQSRWHAGYAPAGWDALTRHLRSLGWPDELIEENRLAVRSRRGNLVDVFRDRAVFPVRSPDGTVAGFIGRASERAAPTVPKYLNSPRNCLYDKSALLFGLWEAHESFNDGARPVIVEGPLDAIAVSTARQHFAGVAPCGTALTMRQLTALSQVADLPTVGVLVAFDADPAGRRAAVRAYHLLCQLTDKVDTVSFQPGQDPAQILADEGPPALAGMLATYTRPLADLVIDSEFDRWANWLRFAEGQVNALRATARLIAAMPPSHVGRQVSRVAIRLGMEHPSVTNAVLDALPLNDLHETC